MVLQKDCNTMYISQPSLIQCKHVELALLWDHKSEFSLREICFRVSKKTVVYK